MRRERSLRLICNTETLALQHETKLLIRAQIVLRLNEALRQLLQFDPIPVMRLH